MTEFKKTCYNCDREELCNHNMTGEKGDCDDWRPDKDALAELEAISDGSGC